MAFEINKITDGELELLPDVVFTPLWKFINPDEFSHHRKVDRQIALLYDAIAKRENHYQVNTPPAYGDPEYRYRCGKVEGFLLAMDAYEEEVQGKIVIRKEKGHRKILVVDKVKRPQSYFEARRENSEVLRSLGF